MCVADFAAFSVALGWGAMEAISFANRLDTLADSIGLRAQLRKTTVSADAVPAMARDAVAIRRLMDPNPREVTEVDAARIYRAVLEVAS